MTVILDTGFEDGALPGASFASMVGDPGGAMTIVTDVVHSGSDAFDVNNAGAAMYGKVTPSAGVRTLTGRCFFRFRSLPSAGSSATIIQINASANLTIQVKSDGTLQGRIVGGSLTAFTGLSAIVIDTWYQLDFKADTSTATYTLDVQLDTVAATNTISLGSLTAADIPQVRFGANGAVTSHHIFDDIKLTDQSADYPLGWTPPPTGDTTPHGRRLRGGRR